MYHCRSGSKCRRGDELERALRDEKSWVSGIKHPLMTIEYRTKARQSKARGKDHDRKQDKENQSASSENSHRQKNKKETPYDGIPKTHCCCKLSCLEHRVSQPGKGHLWFLSPV